MLTEDVDGLYIDVKICPRSRVNQISSWDQEILKIKVHALPEKGKANEAFLEFLAEELNVPKSNVVLLKGKTSSLKKLFLKNMSKKKFLSFLTKVLA